MQTKTWGKVSAWLVLLAPFLCIAALAVMGFVILRHFLAFEVTVRDIQTLLYISMGCVGLCVGALVLGIVVLCKRAAQKGKIIVGMVLGVLMLVLSGMILFGYEYIMGALSVDRGFRQLTDEELGIIDVENGIDRDRGEELIDMQSLLDPAKLQEITRRLNTPADLPEDVAAYMHQGDPVGKSYLRPGAEQIKTFMLYGLDYGEASDLIILVSVDPIHQKIKLNSISRDSFVRMPQWGSFSKLTYAYVWGGPELAVKTLNSNYSMNVNDFVSVDFTFMQKIVDYFGGVDLEIDREEAAYLRADGFRNYTAGLSHLDGAAALSFSRMRHASSSDNDMNRTNRQRKVVAALVAKLKQASVTTYPYVVRECMSMCKTSMSAEDILDLCLQIAQGDYTVEQNMVPRDSQEFIWYETSDYGYYVYDLNRASDYLYRVIYEELYISGYED